MRVDLPSRAARLFELARAHAANGRIDQAIRHTDRALSLYDLGDDNEALRELTWRTPRACSTPPTLPPPPSHLAAARGDCSGRRPAPRTALSRSRRPGMALLSGDTETAAGRARKAVETLGAATDAQRIGDAYLVLARVQD